MTGAPSSRLDDGGPAKPSGNNRRTSVLLREYIAGLDKPYASLGDLRDALGDRGFGVLLFIFALPNLMPVNIPLLSALLGAPLVLLAAQLTYGRHKPWLPQWLTRQSIPFGNWLPAFAICIIGLAMVEKDGVAVLVGLAVGVVSLVVAGTVVIGLVHAFFLLLAGLTGTG